MLHLKTCSPKRKTEWACVWCQTAPNGLVWVKLCNPCLWHRSDSFATKDNLLLLKIDLFPTAGLSTPRTVCWLPNVLLQHELFWGVLFQQVLFTHVFTRVLFTRVLFTRVLFTRVLFTRVLFTRVLFTRVLFTHVLFTHVLFLDFTTRKQLNRTRSTRKPYSKSATSGRPSLGDSKLSSAPWSTRCSFDSILWCRRRAQARMKVTTLLHSKVLELLASRTCDVKRATSFFLLQVTRCLCDEAEARTLDSKFKPNF